MTGKGINQGGKKEAKQHFPISRHTEFKNTNFEQKLPKMIRFYKYGDDY
jgi:hypothetical protein